MKLHVSHRTVYRYVEPVRGIVQSHKLTPLTNGAQSVLAWHVHVEGAERGATFRDGAGDIVDTISVRGPTEEVVVEVEGEVETFDTSGVLRGHRETVVPDAYTRGTRWTRPDRALTELAERAVRGIAADDRLAQAHALCAAIADAISYTPGETEHGTTAAEALALGHGVCADHAHALIAAGLSLDMPGRYVSGYLHSSAEVGAPEASHAWAELWVPDLGWVAFDPSNRTCADERYIRLGSGANAAEAAPIRGIALGLGAEDLDVAVAVTQSAQ
ncbi:MAG: transglutaminase family protein [Pseudomonadota bacterium]